MHAANSPTALPAAHPSGDDLFAETLAPSLSTTAAAASRGDPAELEALLQLVAGGGPAAPRRRLLRQATPAAALAAGPALWRACGLTGPQLAALQSPPTTALERAAQWLDDANHHLLGWHDPDYPPLLRRCPNPPLALFVAGDPGLLWHPAVAIVGSRAPTPAGHDNAGEFARALARGGLLVASGMAAGIDTAAHQAALSVGAPTVAVLGTGPDVPYPRSNGGLHGKIVEHGAIVSEHLPGTGPRREHFPSRNRILAGLSLGILVIEAAHRSGALITARLAAESGREVMALPGSIHNPLARGCHRLLRDGAALVERPEDVIELLAPAAANLAGDLRQRLLAPTSVGTTVVSSALHDPESGLVTTPTRPARSEPPTPTHGPNLQSEAADGAERDHHIVWCALGHDPTGMDQLVERTGLTAARLSSMLLLMELEGRVAAQHGRYFRNR
ncbi:DNA-processing protein DprA [Novilysobacter erysipheiresistens]|uniref:DNA-processing protein DprA n=1 Tax=Novilysobacter erysipheiresistens TaxID=1749332 RepID=A0ABU7YXD4_9GAMM